MESKLHSLWISGFHFDRGHVGIKTFTDPDDFILLFDFSTPLMETELNDIGRQLFVLFLLFGAFTSRLP